MVEKSTGYAEDLTYIHDVGFGHFSTEAAPALLEILRRRGITRGLVVDLGCGSGLWARELSRAGYDVLGIDISPSMLALARKRAPKATFRLGSCLDAALPRCDAVTSLGECLSYQFDENVSRRSLLKLARRVYDALRPGGVFVFDVSEPGRARGAGYPTRFWAGEDWAVLVRFEEDAKRKTFTREITAFRKVGRYYRRSEEVHRQQLYKGTDVAAQLRKIGFRVRTVRGYGGLRFVKGHVGFVARKP